MPDELLEPHLCRRLKLPPSEVRAMDTEELMAHMAYADGVALAEWMRSNG